MSTTKLSYKSTSKNWREVRAEWMLACRYEGLVGMVDAFREVGLAESFGQKVDDTFCSKVVNDLIRLADTLIREGKSITS